MQDILFQQHSWFNKRLITLWNPCLLRDSWTAAATTSLQHYHIKCCHFCNPSNRPGINNLLPAGATFSDLALTTGKFLPLRAAICLSFPLHWSPPYPAVRVSADAAEQQPPQQRAALQGGWEEQHSFALPISHAKLDLFWAGSSLWAAYCQSLHPSQRPHPSTLFWWVLLDR